MEQTSSVGLRSWCAAAALLAVGCPGTVTVPPTGDSAWGHDGPATLDGPSTCSSEDARTSCNAITSAECAPGAACYLVKGSYLDCICPPGTAAEGDSCNTATDCAAGQTCYSSSGSPPGTCRKLCDTNIPACPAKHTCQPLQNWPQLGTCDPD